MEMYSTLHKADVSIQTISSKASTRIEKQISRNYTLHI